MYNNMYLIRHFITKIFILLLVFSCYVGYIFTYICMILGTLYRHDGVLFQFLVSMRYSGNHNYNKRREKIVEVFNVFCNAL